jgi:hypothetical protein
MAVDAARAKSLFLNASELADQAARVAYLERECSGDAELRARGEALLAADGVVLGCRTRLDRQRQVTRVANQPRIGALRLRPGDRHCCEEFWRSDLSQVSMRCDTSMLRLIPLP